MWRQIHAGIIYCFANLFCVSVKEVRRPLEYPRQHAASLFTSSECERIREHSVRVLSFERARIGSGSTQSAEVVLSASTRRAHYAGVPKDDFFYAQVYERIWRFVDSANEKLWRFPISASSMEFMQYAIYSDADEGTYDWHEDVGFHSQTASRVLSVSVQLSEDSEYSGGDLLHRWALHEVAAPRTAGTGVIFPSLITHRVTPVHSGERHSLVLWLQLDAPSDSLALAGDAFVPPTCPPMQVQLPNGQSHDLVWHMRETQEDAALRFCREHDVPHRHEQAAKRQITQALQKHCELL